MPRVHNARERSIWNDMHRRCYAEHRAEWKDYGARGIAVCQEWHDFHTFLSWAHSHGYAADLTIERRDRDGPYSPDNCYWATWKAQARNRKNNRLIEYNGEQLTIAEWAERSGLTPATIWMRLYRRNWSIELALTAPIRITPNAHRSSGAVPTVS